MTYRLDEEMAFDLARLRARAGRPGNYSPTYGSVRWRLVRYLLGQLDRGGELEQEVAWYRARLSRTAWMPGGMSLPSDPPAVPPPGYDPRPRVEI